MYILDENKRVKTLNKVKCSDARKESNMKISINIFSPYFSTSIAISFLLFILNEKGSQQSSDRNFWK